MIGDQSVEAAAHFGEVPTWLHHMGETTREEVLRLLKSTESSFADTDVVRITITPSRYTLGDEYQVGPEVGMRLAIPRAGGVGMLGAELQHMLDQVFALLSGVKR